MAKDERGSSSRDKKKLRKIDKKKDKKNCCGLTTELKNYLLAINCDLYPDICTQKYSNV